MCFDSFFLVTFALTQLIHTEAIIIPQEWQDLLKLVCKENEVNGVCAPVIREICTFSSVLTEIVNSQKVCTKFHY